MSNQLSVDSSPSYTTAQRVVALLAGLACHVAFLAGVGLMVFSIYTGMEYGFGRLHGVWALLANSMLLLQFPIVHSWLLSVPGRKWTARWVPLGLGRELSTTTFATLASIQLLVVFLLWSPSGVTWLRLHGVAGWVMTVLYAAAWLLVGVAMWDAGLALQTGFLGWGAVVRGRRPEYKTFPQGGTYRLSRQPIYLAYSLMLWTGPVWTLDRVALALLWTAYCMLGPMLKERRYLKYYGDAYRAYQRQVPYWFGWSRK